MRKKEPVYLGLDLGSTHVKAAAYNRMGELKALARVSTPTHVTEDGGIYHLASEFWATTVRAIHNCLGQLGDARVRAVGIASMGESGVLLDASGEAVGPTLAWYDPRPSRYLPAVIERVGSLRLFRRTGLSPQAKYSLLKLLWMKEHMNEAWQRGHSWLHIAEFIAFCLTGVKRTEHSLASRTLLYNLRLKAWDHELMQEFGIRKELFQDIIPAGRVVGSVLKHVGELTRLPEGAPVTIAGHDHIVGSFGVGGALVGDVTNSCGTAESLVITMPKQDLDQFTEVPQFTIGHHVVADRYYALMPVGTTGGVVEWFRSITGLSYDELVQVLAKGTGVPANCGFFPMPMSARDPDNPLQNAWFGGALSHTNRDQMAAAVVYGLSCLFRYQVERLLSLNIPMERLLVTGGSTHNRYWMLAKANMLNRPLQVVRDSEGVARGAAILAAKAGDEVVEIPLPPSMTIAPNPEEAARLDRFYKDFYLHNVRVMKEIKAP